VLKTSRGVLTGAADLVPKPMGRLPLLVTGNSGQPLPWIAAHSDGWITYPRSIEHQAGMVARWRAQVQEAAPGRFKPFAQSLYVDLDAEPQLPPTPIHLGFKSGRHFLLRFLEALRGIGVNHVILNLKYGARPAGEVLEEIGMEVLPALAAAGNETSAAAADSALA
jgi:luciferase-type oxidoreductase